MKKILISTIALLLLSCGTKTGTEQELEYTIPRQDTGVVKSISISGGKYQSFIVSIQNKYGVITDVRTKMLQFNVDDSVIIYGTIDDRQIERLKCGR